MEVLLCATVESLCVTLCLTPPPQGPPRGRSSEEKHKAHAPHEYISGT